MRLKPLLTNLAASIVTLLLMLTALELFLRTQWWAGFKQQREARLLDQDLQALIHSRNVSASTFNIYYFGESSMQGEPYAPSVSIPQLVSYMLDGQVEGRPIKSVNLAASGADFAYDLRRLHSVLAQRQLTSPSLCVIYAGHNEFLKYHQDFVDWFPLHPRLLAEAARVLKLYRLEMGERRFFDAPVVDARTRRRVITTYRKQLLEAVRLLREHHIPVIVLTLAGNYSRWQPNRSAFCGRRSDREEFSRLMEAGNQAAAAARVEPAIAAYRQALALCDHFAETHYRLGQSYEAGGDWAQAWREYSQAVDDDGMPMRALSAQNDFIRRLGAAGLASTIDVVERWRRQAAGGLIGFNFLIDAHHPNLNGYIMISRLIAERIAALFSAQPRALRTVGTDTLREVFHVTPAQRLEVYVSRGRWLTRLATWRYDPSERLTLAEAFFLRALAIDPSRYEPYVGMAMVSLLRRDVVTAEMYRSEARLLDAAAVDTYFRDYWVRRVVHYGYAP